jgi:hypothetical protein
MGYRSEVCLAYTKQGWESLMTLLGSASVKDDDRSAIAELINDADEHHLTDAEEHLIVYEFIKTGCDDFQSLMTLNNQVDEEEWYVFYLGEDGAEDSDGGWCDNPFNLHVSRQLNYDTSGTTILCGGVVAIRSSQVINQNAPTIPPPPVQTVNDHTCSVCGNDKCSKAEKSCWRCGTPIG